MDKYRQNLLNQYKRYKKTLYRCSILLNLPNNIENEIMEELDISIMCDICDELLSNLYDNNLIYAEIKSDSALLRDNFIEYRNSPELWNPKAFINSEKWLKWYKSAKNIYDKLYY